MSCNIDNRINDEIIGIVGLENVLLNEPLSKHTTFRIGGPADYYVMPENAEQIKALVTLFKKENVPYYVVGNGSNLLVSDEGYRGAVIQIYKNMSSYFVEEQSQEEAVFKVEAGMSLIKLAAVVAEMGYTGLEFASGIPGTLGGAVCMNAGAYGGEMKDVLISSRLMDSEGNIKEYSVEELELGYRRSVITKTPGEYIVLEATIKLQKGDMYTIKSRIAELSASRKEKQPLEYPSAGSTFKRPEGYFAGKLISDAGLKGFSVGGACVSEKHAGFVVNKKDATAKDVLELTDEVARRVYELYGVRLELEIRKLGF